jgi:hypothetical protein
MYQNNHKENQGYVYHRISLPKPGHSQLQSTSTRCISVSKNDNKPSVLNSSLPNKNITQPKQLSVLCFLISTILGRAITMT